MPVRLLAVGVAAVVSGGVLSACDPVPVADQLTRRPYLTDVVGTSATVNWGTDRSAISGTLRWGTSGNCTANSAAAIRTAITVNGVSEYQWKATVTVAPDTAYCYRIYLKTDIDLLGGEPAPTFRSQLPAADPASYSFVVFGDWGKSGSDGTNPHQANLLSRVAGSGARFAVTTGDIAYPAGSQKSYGDIDQRGPDLSNVFSPEFWPVPGKSMPMFPAGGNHSPETGFITNWPEQTAASTSGGRHVVEPYPSINGSTPKSYASSWYAFDAGRARFYVLDAMWDGSNLGTGSQYENDYDAHWTPSAAEYQWLQNDLATHPTPLKFAFFHYPLYSDNSSQSSDTFLQGANSLEGLLGRNGVDLVFNGHAHVYQRNRAATGGVVSYVTGGGGASLASMGGRGCGPLDAYGIGWKEGTGGSACGSAPVPGSSDHVYHFLKVTVNTTSVTVTPTDELGRTFDVQTYGF
jgi:hypothetical protein